MKITLICIGKTDEDYLKNGVEKYLQRLRHYISFEMIVIPDIKKSKNLSQEQQKQKEAQLILKQLKNQDYVVLLDEKGNSYSSVGFSDFIQQRMNQGLSNLVFVIGGPYGFNQDLFNRANGMISLSKMTFSHQMVRLFFVEQIYRAFTIMKGEPYHHV